MQFLFYEVEDLIDYLLKMVFVLFLYIFTYCLMNLPILIIKYLHKVFNTTLFSNLSIKSQINSQNISIVS
jgi:hypothetical protein